MADAFNKTFESNTLTGNADSFTSAWTNGDKISVSAAAALNGSKALQAYPHGSISQGRIPQTWPPKLGFFVYRRMRTLEIRARALSKTDKCFVSRR